MKPTKLNNFFKKASLNEEVRLSKESLDSQIDSILMGYQSNAFIQQERTLKSLSSILIEQLPGEEENSAEPGEESRPESVVGDEQPAAEEESDPNVPKIDLDLYAQKVVNLLDNYQTLLDVMPVIINRAKNLLRQTYQEDVIVEFEDILDRDFGVSLEERGKDEMPEVPLGGNAGYPPPG